MVLRQSICSCISNNLDLMDGHSHKKSTLFLLINALKSSGAASMPHLVPNALCALTCVSQVLRTSEVLEIILPALTKILDDSSLERFHDYVWECLGNITLSCNENVFREILNYFLDNFQKSVGKVKLSWVFIFRFLKSVNPSLKRNRNQSSTMKS
jgi:hypothetical protein